MATGGARGNLLRVVFGQGLGSLANFLTLLALGRWAGEAQLGLFALAWSGLFLALSLTDTLVATPYTYHRAQATPPAPDLAMAAAWGPLGLAALLALLLSLPPLLGTLGLADGAGGLADAMALWPALPAALAAAVLREFRRRHLLAVGEAPALLRLDTAGALLQLAGIGLLAAADRLSAAGALACVAGAATLPMLPLLGPARLARLRAARADAVGVLKRFLHYGHWLLAGGLCHVLSVQAYPWLAFAAGGARLAGLWAAANALVNLLSPLLTALTNHERPRLMQAAAGAAPPALRAEVWRRLPLFAAPAAALALALTLFGEPLLSRLYGVGFAAAAPALPWLGLGLLAVAFGAPVQLGLLARGAPSSNLAYHATALAVLGLVLGALWLARGTPSLQALAGSYTAANLLATVVLVGLFLRGTRASQGSVQR